MNTNTKQISDLMLDVISEFYERDTQAKTFGTDTVLYHSEIHMLHSIAENPNLHIAGIARMMGITRGAASQTIKRLEAKQMLLKDSDPTDGKRVILRLTPKGQTAYQNHKSAHETHCQRMEELLAAATGEELQFLSSFLTRFQQSLATSSEKEIPNLK